MIDKSIDDFNEEFFGEVDTSRTIGWFTSVYPHILNVGNRMSILESVVSVKESLRKIPNKGMGYGMLNYLSEMPLSKVNWNVEFNYLGDLGTKADEQAEGLFDYTTDAIGSDIADKNGTDCLLSVSGMIVKGELYLSIRYNDAYYDLSLIHI